MMKKIIFIAFLFLSFGSFAQTKITATLVRNSPSDNYPVTSDSLQRGGMHVYASFAERDAIPLALRKFGMLATVNSFVFQLGAGLTNSDWVAFKPGGPVPTLQQVTTAGAESFNAISISAPFQSSVLSANALNFSNFDRSNFKIFKVSF